MPNSKLIGTSRAHKHQADADHVKAKRAQPARRVFLSVDFNDEGPYCFRVEIPEDLYDREVWTITGTNSSGKTFTIGFVGAHLMDLIARNNISPVLDGEVKERKPLEIALR